MKCGQVVTVFFDPETEDKPEGKAVLVKRNCNLWDNMESWRVKFEDDGFVADRIVKNRRL